MAIQIGARPDAGFDDPLGMLVDCHRRVERFLNVLCRVAERAEGRALSGEEIEAVEAALHYFRESGPRHNSDEEDSLFPRLRECLDPGGDHRSDEARGVLVEIDRLRGEHRENEVLHRETEELFAKWIAEGALHGADRNRLRAATARMEKIYKDHIRIEEQLVFPRAKKVLAPAAIFAMSEEFKTRRS